LIYTTGSAAVNYSIGNPTNDMIMSSVPEAVRVFLTAYCHFNVESRPEPEPNRHITAAHEWNMILHLEGRGSPMWRGVVVLLAL
jgi:hypothetical protein